MENKFLITSVDDKSRFKRNNKRDETKTIEKVLSLNITQYEDNLELFEIKLKTIKSKLKSKININQHEIKNKNKRIQEIENKIRIVRFN